MHLPHFKNPVDHWPTKDNWAR